LNNREPLHLLKTIDHSIGRAKTHQLVSDRAGREPEFAGSAGRHAVGDKTDPTRKNEEEFALALARELGVAADLNRFEALILVAGPRFLGLLRKNLSPGATACVVGSVPLNLGNIPDAEVPSYLWKALEEYDRTAGLGKPA
jgi:protein required for attachment to host cells